LIADIAFIFHWPLSEIERLDIADLIHWRDMAVTCWNRANEQKAE